MPDVLENGCPRSNTDTGTNENRDFILENVFSGGTIRPIDTEARHLLSILKSNLIHTHRVNSIVKLGLSATGTESITQGLGEITNLANVNRDIRVEGARGDCKRVPLVLRDGGDLKEEPLASLVSERGLVKLDLNNIVRVANDAGDFGLPASSNLAVDALNHVKTASPELPTPAEVTDAMSPVLVSSEGREGVNRITHKAPSSVSVESQHERDKKVMSVPKSLKRLLSNASMGRRVHEEHAKEHDVARDTTCLSIVNLQSADRANLSLFNVVEVDVMGTCVECTEHEHSICELSVNPDVFVEGKETNLGSYPSHNGTADRQQDEHAIDTEDETGTSGDPY